MIYDLSILFRINMKNEKNIKSDKTTFPLIILIIFIVGIIFFLSQFILATRIGEINIFGYTFKTPIILESLVIYSLVFTGLFIFSLIRPKKTTPKKAREEMVSKVITPVFREETLPFVEVYPVDEPYAYAGIIKRENKIEYRVLEPTLDKDESKLMEKLESLLYEELDIGKTSFETKEESAKFLSDKIDKILKRYKWNIEASSLGKIKYYIIRDHIGYGKIDPLMKDENIEDISCNGPKAPVYVYHRFYESISTSITFEEEELDDYIIRLAYLAGKHISISTPIIDATLPDGTRINLTYRREISRKGSTFTIRKFRKKPFTTVDLINLKTINEDVASFLWFTIENMASLLVAGGTATGKTTLLNALSLFIRPEKKIVSIEDTAELQLYHENWNAMVERTGFGIRGGEAEIKMFELLKTALRQRPDIIIVGEVRGEEAYTMFQAMATGHGALGSIHAENPSAVISRLTSEPMNVPESLILTLDMIILISRVKIGHRIYRKVIGVYEPYWNDIENKISIKTVYEWDAYKDIYRFKGESLTLNKIGGRTGVTVDSIKKEIDRRKIIIRWMAKKNIHEYTDFINIIRKFYMNPDEVYDTARLELLEIESK